MVITYTKRFTMKSLLSIARIHNIKHISGLSKDSLLRFINIHKNVMCIQRKFRSGVMDQECPICMEKLNILGYLLGNKNKTNYYGLRNIDQVFIRYKRFQRPANKISDIR